MKVIQVDDLPQKWQFNPCLITDWKKTTAKQGVNWWNFCNNNAAGLFESKIF
jgi:hypothetical protein